jgi:5'-methylthioinosine phosphorylase
MLAIIGGTGLASEDTFTLSEKKLVSTIYGEPSSALLFGELNSANDYMQNQNVQNKENAIVFLSRHGFAHNIPPHKVNYRANIQALKDQGVTTIIAVNAVGGISEKMSPGTIVLPDQIVDYTYGREHTFFAENIEHVTHIDFTYPYNQQMIDKISLAANDIQIDIVKSATYACTQGPRLESIAEIRRLTNDGCDIVGMTAMPEAALAKEAEINYASISFVANWAAGISEAELSMEDIEAEIKQGMDKIKALLVQSASLIYS